MKRYIAVVGNRYNVPEYVLSKIRAIGKLLTDKGFTISSGGAVGCDRAVWEGACESERYGEVGARIYLVDFKGSKGDVAETDSNFIDSSTLDYFTALNIALKAAPHITYQKDYVKRLHARNVHQILGSYFNAPVEALIYYSEPIEGFKERVKGGTNTALQVAKNYNVPYRINLFGLTEEQIDLEIDKLLKALIGLELYTIQMGQWRKAKAMDVELVDITHKTNNAFAPNRRLVYQYKSGQIDEGTYTRIYNRLMEKSMDENRDEWLELINKDQVAIACFCGPKEFCHRKLLVDHIQFFCYQYDRGLVYRGEIT